MRVIAAFFGPYAPDALASHVSVFSHDCKRFERFTKLATSSIEFSTEVTYTRTGTGENFSSQATITIAYWNSLSI